MTFRKKAKLLLDNNADIIVIQESEHTDKLDTEDVQRYPNKIWIGSNKNKGLLVASKDEFPIEKYDIYTEDYKFILPLRVESKSPFNLFAVWAQNDKINHKNRYIGQVWLALNKYKDLLHDNCIVVGDFNSNKIWDNEPRVANHSDVVKLLQDAGIQSLYHYLNREDQGQEKQKTLFFRKNPKVSYHIDYCFASASFLLNSPQFKILSDWGWVEHSDHLPLVIDLKVD